MCKTLSGCIIVVLGEVIDTENMILLEDVPVITPNGDVVVKSLSFKVRLFASHKEDTCTCTLK